MNIDLKGIITGIILINISCLISAQIQNSIPSNFKVSEINDSLFTNDNNWRGADGAATVDLKNGKILWLFSDTFIDTSGTRNRAKSLMINNSVAIQDGYSLNRSKLKYYWRGNGKVPASFFDIPGENWFWTGHGIVVKNQLVIFLFEEKSTTEGFGFEAVGWWIAVIENYNDDPLFWKPVYYKGPYDLGIIHGSSAVLSDSDYVYSYSVKEPGEHEVYLVRIGIDNLIKGELTSLEWWVKGIWERDIKEEPKSSALFKAQTEFSVHFDARLEKYIQIQTFGFGQASLGSRFADCMQGPWSDPVIFYTPELKDKNEFVYSAKAHPEIKSNGLFVTYNVNNFDFKSLFLDQSIYFPKQLLLDIDK